MHKNKNIYQGQIDEVLHYINSMIQKKWTCSNSDAFNHSIAISTLANVAEMSRRNLQLIFKAYMGETLHQYIIRLRIEFALQLYKEGNMTGTEISEYIGFANQPALNNIFQKKYNQTPQERLLELSQKSHDYPLPISPYHIVESESTSILFLTHIGNYDTCNSISFEESNWELLYKYAKQNELLPEREEYWGIAYDDTDITPINKCRFYSCITIQDGKSFTIPRSSSIKCMKLPKAMYSVYTHQGPYSLLDSFYETILKQLPPHYYLGESPILEHYLNSPIDTDSQELLTEIWIPICE